MLKVNGKEVDYRLDETLGMLIERQGYVPGQVAAEVNLEIVPREEFKTRRITDGDEVEIVRFVGGGS